MTKINPYLNFKGEAEEAFNFYKSVFGGEFSTVMRYGEIPGFEEMQIDRKDGNKIVNIALPISDGHVLMGNDVVGEHVDKTTDGINISISVSPDSKEKTEKIFNGLSESGEIEMPLGYMPGRSHFGILKDKFGIRWLVNYDYDK